MDILWEVVRWLYKDYFVPHKHPQNTPMDKLASTGGTFWNL